MEFKFTPQNIEKIKAECEKYPSKKSAVMKTLYLGQEQNGFISNEVIEATAVVLEIPKEEVFGVVTFYTMYHQKSIGKYHLQVCTNVSCMLRGAQEIYKTVQDKLSIKNGEMTADGLFSLEEVECMGSCGTAPMIAINEDFFENISKEAVLNKLETLK